MQTNISRCFFQFLGIHSLLIGLFPFFLPVYLYKQQYSLAHICFFIALSGLSFCFTLWIWDRLHKRISLLHLIIVSFVLEIGLLFSVSIHTSTLMLVGVSLTYGAYNCFFWTTQRALFFEKINNSNTGREYGNFQIFVAAVLQIGILIGAIVLEKQGLMLIYFFSVIIILIGAVVFFKQRETLSLPSSLKNRSPISLKEIFAYKDSYKSKTIFILDGFYLFLESHFWLISIFLIAHESFWKLGVAVITLSLIFFLLFVLLKNTIDHLSTKLIYKFATALYALSWVLRSFITNDLSLELLFAMMVGITFCTSFFRLAFNKRFYDTAKITTKHGYLILKSFYSQVFIAIVYSGLGLILTKSTNPTLDLSLIYFISGPLAFSYLVYANKQHRASIPTSSDIIQIAPEPINNPDTLK